MISKENGSQRRGKKAIKVKSLPQKRSQNQVEAGAGEDGTEGTQKCDRGGDEEYERGEIGGACRLRGSGTRALPLSPL